MARSRSGSRTRSSSPLGLRRTYRRPSVDNQLASGADEV